MVEVAEKQKPPPVPMLLSKSCNGWKDVISFCCVQLSRCMYDVVLSVNYATSCSILTVLQLCITSLHCTKSTHPYMCDWARPEKIGNNSIDV